MAKAYLISCYREIKDPAALAEYGKLAAPAIEAAGGRFLARGGKVQAFEAGVAERTVVIEFDIFEQAVPAFNGASYGSAPDHLGDAVVPDLRFV